MVAVPVENVDTIRNEQCPELADCRQCDIKVVEDLASRPELRAVCVSQLCMVVDLREEALTACENDTDCEPFLRGDNWLGWCGCYTGSPREWFALRKGEVDPNPFVPPEGECGGCDYSIAPPDAFCADDKHCAVRETPTVDGERSETCYSPWQALDSAYSPEAQGCDCYGGGPFCKADSTGNLIALICSDDDLVGYWNHRWSAVEDGSCAN